MKTNVLRMPLLKAAGILVIFSLLVYFTSTDPDASVWTSIGTIFVAAFTTVQWLLAMAIGLTVCIAVLIGIFLGAVAIGNPTAASSMYEGLRQDVLSYPAPLLELWNKAFTSDSGIQLGALTAMFEDLKNDIKADVQTGQAAISKMEQAQAGMISKIDSLASRLATLEKTTAGLATGQQVEELGEEVKTVVESTAGMREVVDNLQKTVKETADKAGQVSAENILGDLPARLEALDLASLEKNISDLQTELAAVKKSSTPPAPAAALAETTQTTPKAEPAQATKAEEHRIFSYFENDTDKKKVAELVASTLKKDMSYKQVIDLVAKGLGSNGEIITSHPSLSKDYIRLCRRNS
jgi:hypothetical protein